MHEQEIPLLPRRLFFDNPDRAAVQLSPDGAYLSFLAPLDGVLNVWTAPVDNPDAARPLTHDTGRGIRHYVWAYTNRHVLYIQDKEGDENWRLYGVDLRTGEAKDLTPLDGVQARIQQRSPSTPGEILVGLNDRRKDLHDIYRLDIATGERTLVQENEGFAGFVTDDEYRVRLAERMTPDGGGEMLKPSADGGWELFITVPMEDMLTMQAFAIDPTGKALYAADSRQRDTASLVTIDLQSGLTTLLAEDPRADLADVLMHPADRTVQAAAFVYDRKQWKVLDSAIAADLEYLRGVAAGDLEIVSRTLDDRHWIAAFLMDDGPVRYYHYDRSARTARFLFTNRRNLADKPLAKMQPAIIPARDGLRLVSYLSLPRSADPGQLGRPDRPLPLVLFVHGGPWARDSWGLHPVHQWLTNRGYAVLSVNYRGSVGFGKTFVNAGNREWAGRMHDDLVDAVSWAIDQGIADRDRVAIMGGSYGGFATLVGLTYTPELFACGVDIVGPSSLVTLLESIPPYWKPQIEMFAKRVGDHRTEDGRAFLAERSPLHRADRISRPLLIGQGANDPRVKQAESDQIVAAMHEHGVPVTYVLYPDEGHGFARPANSLSFYAIAEAFLGQCLGGRVEPIGGDFAGSTVTVVTGAEGIVGLREAIEMKV